MKRAKHRARTVETASVVVTRTYPLYTIYNRLFPYGIHYGFLVAISCVRSLKAASTYLLGLSHSLTLL